MPEQPTAHDRAVAGFVARFGAAPGLVVRSPGRVNLIGDHTDYSEGFVLPIAIDRGLWLALRSRPDRLVRIWAELTGEWAEFDLDRLEDHSGWTAYVQGVAFALTESGDVLAGFDGVLTSDLPAGAGLSSSAALELAAARAFATVSKISWDPAAMALACQRAENDWVGMNCGIMDQLICAVGEPDHAMLIDCRTLETTPTPIPPQAAVVVLDTMTRRELVDSAYNERRIACETAAAAFGVEVLRDLDIGTLRDGAKRLDPVVHRRARHVLNENAATLAAAAALRRGDLGLAGALMNESHQSLATDYEVSTPALDAMAEAARRAAGCYGARMTGAGFGGSVVALVAVADVDAFATAALDGYRAATGTVGTAILVTASAGVSVVG
jgi:galactokinase